MSSSTAQRYRHAAGGASQAARPVDDTRITEITELAPPSHLLREFPVSDTAAVTTYDTRAAIPRIQTWWIPVFKKLLLQSRRGLVVVYPVSMVTPSFGVA